MVRVRNGCTASEPFRERLAEESLQVYDTRKCVEASRIRWVAPMQQYSHEKWSFHLRYNVVGVVGRQWCDLWGEKDKPGGTTGARNFQALVP
jgi:hypothetical protein